MIMFIVINSLELEVLVVLKLKVINETPNLLLCVSFKIHNFESEKPNEAKLC